MSKATIKKMLMSMPKEEIIGMVLEMYDARKEAKEYLEFYANPDDDGMLDEYKKMSNRVWEYKNKILASTNHLKINHEILQKDHWTLTDIEDRTQQLIAEIARLYPYYEAKDSSVTKVPICINYQNAYVQGYYYPDNGSVEILEGSTLYMDLPSPESYPEVETMRAELKDNGILREDNQHLFFATNHSFYPKRVNATALSTTAAIILHGSRNDWEYWMNEDGVQLGEVEGLRKNNE